MKYLLVNPKLLTFILFLFLLLPSCNNEELFVVEESAIIAEDTEPTEEEEPNTEDVAPAIDVVDDTVMTMQHEPVDIEVHLNDINLPESIALSNTNPSNGILTINNNDTPENLIDDTIVYTPNAGFSGVDAFDYTMCDATNTENCDTATVTITVEPTENDFATELKAFPSAYGGGAYVTGGRGGKVLHVTTTDDGTQQGTLRWALAENYPRIIVFDVSGIFNFNYTVSTEYPIGYGDVTIAGETAPEGGVTLTGNVLFFQGQENIIIRHIKFRNPQPVNSRGWCLVLNNGVSDVIVDNCSFSFSSQIAISMGSASTSETCRNITVQNCLFGECRDAMYIGNGNLDITGISEIGSVSLLRNAFSNVGWRVPGNPVGTSASGKSFDYVNNIAHNWWYRTFRIAGVAPHLNMIGNYYQAGNHTESQFPSEIGLQELPLFVANSGEMTGAKIFMFDNPIESVNTGYTPLDYLSPKTGSISYSVDANGNTSNPSSAWFPFGSSNTTPIAATNQFLTTQEIALTNPHPVLLRASDVASTILPDIGANKYLNADGTVGTYRDDLDTMYVNWIINGTSSSYQSTTKTPPTNMPVNTRPAGYDTDGDGMPDIWETATFGDLTKTSSDDEDGDGYTNIEEFLSLIDK